MFASLMFFQIVLLIIALFALVRLVIINETQIYNVHILYVYIYSCIINFIPIRYMLYYRIGHSIEMSMALGAFYILMIKLLIILPMYNEDLSVFHEK
jgi:hypothetical protein